ncbi:dipeptide ABC transporter ATP-binding protein [Neobacillus sp. 179-C4.2 HS]|uniref:Dipeptide ABC transporter ATP-binding protein n=1 Tax=Neobacillus driksii TaxID=3035913 RepID=A0ABV4YRQ0_9BACI|nr:dipeptide ABC transporter ATP-binding protein [Neobacillus sp. 179.-C4.2 HS]MDP5195112.1 dipeptide ABC transporter ATP-binding protein [Neobacillus sp. 179.-C4.2 HS]
MLEQGLKNDIILDVRGLKKYYEGEKLLFGKSKSVVKAVDNISFQVQRGETFSIVGESGCGKSTTGMCLLRLIDPTSGEIYFNREDALTLKNKELKGFRKDIQVIFQDPYSSLNPKHTVRSILREPYLIHKTFSNTEIDDQVHRLIELVGLDSSYLDRYPHEFSGGQRQRIGIARALALNPQLIVCDEPVSALDVSIQAQIINLLKELQQQLNLTYIFISHDLSVVEHISNRVVVMYLGKIVEMGTRDQIFNDPKHPYTQALLASIPIANPEHAEKKQRVIIKGDLPSPKNPPKGCHFYSRCPVKMEQCKDVYPEVKILPNQQQIACHLY